MSTIKTVVSLIVFSSFNVVVAEEGKSIIGGTSPKEALAACKEIHGANAPKDVLERCLGISTGSNAGTKPCDDALKNYNETQKELRKSCREAGASLSKCEDIANKCSNISQKIDPDALQINTAGDMTFGEGTDEIYKDCPSLAAGNIKTWKETIKENTKTIEDLQKQKIKAQTRTAEQDTDLQKQLQEIDKQMADVDAAKKEMESEFPIQLKNTENKFSEKLSQLSQSLEAQKKTIFDLEDAELESTRRYRETIMKADIDCREAAKKEYQQKVEMPTATMQEYRMYNVSGGAFGVKNDRRGRTAVLAQYENYFCTQSTVKGIKAAADESFKSSLESIRKRKDHAEKLITQQTTGYQDLIRQADSERAGFRSKYEARVKKMDTDSADLMQKRSNMILAYTQRKASAKAETDQIDQMMNRRNVELTSAATNITNAGKMGIGSDEKAPPPQVVAQLAGDFSQLGTYFCEAQRACDDTRKPQMPKDFGKTFIASTADCPTISKDYRYPASGWSLKNRGH